MNIVLFNAGLLTLAFKSDLKKTCMNLNQLLHKIMDRQARRMEKNSSRPVTVSYFPCDEITTSNLFLAQTQW